MMSDEARAAKRARNKAWKKTPKGKALAAKLQLGQHKRKRERKRLLAGLPAYECKTRIDLLNESLGEGFEETIELWGKCVLRMQDACRKERMAHRQKTPWQRKAETMARALCTRKKNDARPRVHSVALFVGYSTNDWSSALKRMTTQAKREVARGSESEWFKWCRSQVNGHGKRARLRAHIRGRDGQGHNVPSGEAELQVRLEWAAAYATVMCPRPHAPSIQRGQSLDS